MADLEADAIVNELKRLIKAAKEVTSIRGTAKKSAGIIDYSKLQRLETQNEPRLHAVFAALRALGHKPLPWLLQFLTVKEAGDVRHLEEFVPKVFEALATEEGRKTVEGCVELAQFRYLASGSADKPLRSQERRRGDGRGGQNE